MDRAHRIGQTRPVTVYRLINRNSVEERIMNIQKFKTAVAKSIVNEQNASRESMSTYCLAEAFVTGSEDVCKKKKRKTSDLNSVLEELDYLWSPLSKLDDFL